MASDRISAFDVIMPNGIPRKGEVLTQISFFWFGPLLSLARAESFARFGANDPLPKNLQPFADSSRAALHDCKKAKACWPSNASCAALPSEIGLGAGRNIKKSQTVCGILLPGGFTPESAELPEAIFTPSTKADEGHDENISFDEACKIVGKDLATQARDLSLKIYNAGRDYARQRGIIIADTKFEFGVFEGKLILIDEVLTPDSSRFWPADQYQPGKGQPSFDKQFVRDYLETLDWDKTPPGPKLPEDVVAKTSAKYLDAYERLTGKKL